MFNPHTKSCSFEQIKEGGKQNKCKASGINEKQSKYFCIQLLNLELKNNKNAKALHMPWCFYPPPSNDGRWISLQTLLQLLHCIRCSYSSWPSYPHTQTHTHSLDYWPSAFTPVMIHCTSSLYIYKWSQMCVCVCACVCVCVCTCV